MKNLKNLFLTVLLLAVFVVPTKAFALEYEEVGSKEALLSAIKAGKNVKLTADILGVNETIAIDKAITIDLNGKSISFTKEKHFMVKNGNLTLNGKGTIKEEEPWFGPVMLYGSVNKTDVNYSTVTVGKDVTLEGWAPVFIDKIKGEDGLFYGYGITANIYGTLNGIPDNSGDKGHGIYINGDIKHKENYPVINVYSGAKVTTPGDGIYAAGYAKWNIEGASITGEIGIGAKAGIFNIKDTTIKATGKYAEPVWDSNGIQNTGAAIQLESNNSYAGGINFTIDGGRIESANSYAISHYLAAKDGNVATVKNSLENLTIKNGAFVGSVSGVSIKAVDGDKISVLGGTFPTSEVEKYVADGYKLVKGSNNYTVVKEGSEIVMVPTEVKVSSDVDAEIAKEISGATLDNSNSGLLEAIDKDKLQIPSNSLVEVTISTEVKAYDKEKKTLTYEIKPYYSASGELIGEIPNSAINGLVKVKVLVPASITESHAKVIHSLNGQVLDEKSYEIKEDNGQKYIIIETNSFSVFELNFYTPSNGEENPKTFDGLMTYIILGMTSLIALGSVSYLSRKKLFSK